MKPYEVAPGMVVLAVKPPRGLRGRDVAGISIFIGVVLVVAVAFRLMRRDSERNRRAGYLRQWEARSALRAFDRERATAEGEAAEGPAEQVTALPDRLSPEDFRALPQQDRDRLLARLNRRPTR